MYEDDVLKDDSPQHRGISIVHRKTPCKYGPVFALYLYRIESNRVNTVQKRVRIYMAFSCGRLVLKNGCSD